MEQLRVLAGEAPSSSSMWSRSLPTRSILRPNKCESVSRCGGRLRAVLFMCLRFVLPSTVCRLGDSRLSASSLSFRLLPPLISRKLDCAPQTSEPSDELRNKEQTNSTLAKKVAKETRERRLGVI
eukprot:5980545-Pyramimonas_sp.AAC.1